MINIVYSNNDNCCGYIALCYKKHIKVELNIKTKIFDFTEKSVEGKLQSFRLMPVEKLPTASWQSAFGLGFISAVFDNIPLTALALKQGGYDWGFLAYAVGFGGSMLWFGSSAGVAVANLFPEAKSVGQWLRYGWMIPVGYVAGFFVMLAVLGWQPHERHKEGVPPMPTAAWINPPPEETKPISEPFARTLN